MGDRIFSNNGSSTITAQLAPGQTNSTVVDGADFPNPTGDEYFMATVEDSSGNYEVVKCTSRSANTIYFDRAQEGTLEQTFASGSRFECRLTASGLESFLQRDGDTATATIKGPTPTADTDYTNKLYVDTEMSDHVDATGAHLGTKVSYDNTNTIAGYWDFSPSPPTGIGSLGIFGENTQEAFEAVHNYMQRTVNHLVDKVIYPVNCVASFTDGTDPHTLVQGSTWVQIAQGRVLVGIGTDTDETGVSKTFVAGNNNGAYKVTLIASQLPPHTHAYDVHTTGADPGGNHTMVTYEQNWVPERTIATNAQTHTPGAVQNMPPTYGVNLWRRTL